MDEVKKIDCSTCGGSGQIPNDFPMGNRNCLMCFGSGKITITKKEIDEEIASYRQDILDIQEEIKELEKIFNG